MVSLDPYITSQFHHLMAGHVGLPLLPTVHPGLGKSLISTGYLSISRWPVPELGTCVHHMFSPSSHPRRSLTGKVAQDQAEALWKIATKFALVNLGRREAEECPELKDAVACHKLSGLLSCKHSRRCNLEAASLFPIILFISALAPLLT